MPACPLCLSVAVAVVLVLSSEITGGRNLQQFMDWAQAQDPVRHVPPLTHT